MVPSKVVLEPMFVLGNHFKSTTFCLYRAVLASRSSLILLTIRRRFASCECLPSAFPHRRNSLLRGEGSNCTPAELIVFVAILKSAIVLDSVPLLFLVVPC